MAEKDPFESPDSVELKAPVTGITRLSKKLRLILTLGGAAFIGFVVFSIYTIDNQPDPTQAAKQEADDEKASKRKALEPSKPDAVTQGIGDGQAMARANAGDNPTDPNAPGAVSPAFSVNNNGAVMLNKPSQASAKASASAGQGEVTVPSTAGAAQPQQTPEQLAAQRLKQQRDQSREEAWKAGSDVSGFDDSGRSSAVAPTSPFLASPQAAGQGMPNMLAAGGQTQDDINKQLRKESFLREAESKLPETYLKETRRPAASKYQINAGWKIPAALECGMNSDLPGQVCARVRENVYDSATGTLLLIPQGSMITGTYDSQVAIGQERMLVVWNLLIFPDGSTLNLMGMPGADQGGYAGFEAEVDNHYFRVFGGAALLSVISAGIQLSQPQPVAGQNSGPSAQQTIAGAIGQQVGQVGSSMVQRNMQIQPTLKQKPGYRFMINVTRHIVLPGPYVMK